MQHPLTDAELRQELNLETAQIAWRDLQYFFASGAVISVARDLDLIEVALQLSRDNKAQFEQWLTQGRVHLVKDEQARQWWDEDAQLWSVVVKPWVLVQP